MAVSLRDDVHKASAIRPEDYEFVEAYDNQVDPYLAASVAVAAGSDSGEEARQVWERYMAERREVEKLVRDSETSVYKTTDRCDHCGAYLRYSFIYRYLPAAASLGAGENISVGADCAHNTMDVPDRATLELKRLKDKAAASKRRVAERRVAEARRETAREDYPEAVGILEEAYREGAANAFISDVAERFADSGRLTKAQAEAVVGARREDECRGAEEADRVYKSVPTGKALTVEGTMLKVYVHEGSFGARSVMLVEGDGWKVWGSNPASWKTSDDHPGPEPGDKVRFVADVRGSDDDPSFGFLKRPRKAEVLAFREPPQPDPEEVEKAEREAVRAVVANVRERLREAGEVPDTFDARRAVTILDDLVEGGYDGAVTVAKLWWEKTGGREVSRFREEWDAVRRENALGAYRVLSSLLEDGVEGPTEGMAGHLSRLADQYIALGGSPEDVGR